MRVDANVRAIADSFGMPASKEDLLGIVNGINLRLFLCDVDSGTLKSLYLRRPAGEILQSGRMLGGVSRQGGSLVGGCMDQVVVLMAVLRAKGFVPGKNLFFIRVKSEKGPGHSLAEVKLENGARYFVDPRNERVYRNLKEFTDVWFKAIKAKKGGIVLRGATPRGAGVRTLEDAFHPGALTP